MANEIDVHATATTRARYNRIAPVYDLLETLLEHTFKPWRVKLWSCALAEREDQAYDNNARRERTRSQARGEILEVGVGTGKNLPYYPHGAHVVGIDLAEQMLTRAQKRARQLDVAVELVEGDVQQLEFADNSFDTAVATFVFCSVPDPVRGLRELNRVVKRDGSILLLDHVRIDRPVMGRIMDSLNPLIVRLWGANINRRTIENVQRAGLCIEEVKHLGPMGMVKLIRARPNK